MLVASRSLQDQWNYSVDEMNRWPPICVWENHSLAMFWTGLNCVGQGAIGSHPWLVCQQHPQHTVTVGQKLLPLQNGGGAELPIFLSCPMEFTRVSRFNPGMPSIVLLLQLSTNRRVEIDDSYPLIRWHQTADYGYVPNNRMSNTFMAVAIDLGDDSSPYGR